MEKESDVFNGKQFSAIGDFEREFKPSKWSIRKFMLFISTFNHSEKWRAQLFFNHAIDVLSGSIKKDKDTLNFINKLKEKKDTLYGWHPSKYQSKNLIRVTKDHYNEFIKLMAYLRKRGIIKGSGTNLAEILKDNFGISYSLSTINDKIYKLNEDLIDKNLLEDLNKNFQKLSDTLK